MNAAEQLVQVGWAGVCFLVGAGLAAVVLVLIGGPNDVR